MIHQKAAFMLLAVLGCVAQFAGAGERGFGPGRIDILYRSGYIGRGHGYHGSGKFVVCPGCTGCVPTRYREFAPLVYPDAAEHVGASWYLGAQPAYLGPSWGRCQNIDLHPTVSEPHANPADSPIYTSAAPLPEVP